LIVISLAGGFNVELFSYLFGSILTIDTTDLVLVSFLGSAVVLFIVFFRRELLSMVFDEEDSRIIGIPTKKLSTIFDLLVAVTIVLSIKVIVTILIVALLVIPGLCALKLDLSFRKTLFASVGFSILSIILGITFSAAFNVVTAGLIVFVLVLFFPSCFTLQKIGLNLLDAQELLVWILFGITLFFFQNELSNVLSN
jgi:zinc transport system permease protein